MISWLVLAIGLGLAVVAVIVIAHQRRRATERAQHLEDVRTRAGEAAARAEVERARAVASLLAVEDGLVIADASGSIVFRNSVAERYHGARRSDAVAEDIVERLLARALDGESCEQELPLFGPPRSTLIVRAVPLQLDGVPLGAAAFVRDVTELRRVEQVRRDSVMSSRRRSVRSSSSPRRSRPATTSRCSSDSRANSSQRPTVSAASSTISWISV
jgi:signal transduction histidine kinase